MCWCVLIVSHFTTTHTSPWALDLDLWWEREGALTSTPPRFLAEDGRGSRFLCWTLYLLVFLPFSLLYVLTTKDWWRLHVMTSPWCFLAERDVFSTFFFFWKERRFWLSSWIMWNLSFVVQHYSSLCCSNFTPKFSMMLILALLFMFMTYSFLYLPGCIYIYSHVWLQSKSWLK